MTPKLAWSARLILGTIALVALLAALAFAPLTISMLLFVRLVVWGLVPLAGFVGALIVGIVLSQVARTGEWPSAADKRLLWAGVVAVAVGNAGFLPASSRVGAAVRDPPLVAAMRTDLRNLVAAESLYYAASNTHTRDLAALDWFPSPGV